MLSARDMGNVTGPVESTVVTEEKGEIMGGPALEGSPYRKLHHIGVVVSDIDKAIAHFESLGFGPFQFSEGVRTFTIDFTGELHGEPAEWKVKISNAKIGDIELELAGTGRAGLGTAGVTGRHGRRPPPHRVPHR